MKLEVEIKLQVGDLKEFLERLGGLRPRRVAERKSQDDFILDLPQMRFKEKGSLLRVRNEGGRGFVTFKGPARVNKNFKVREELETECDPVQMLELFQKLGYQISFRYQKYRTIYQVRVATRRKGRPQPISVMIDETPIGNYVELEGNPQGVSRVAGSLGFKKKDFIRESYHSLFLSFCKKNRCSLRDMVFR
ncbi:MAG: class IV adenylate cyclase [Acidobacteria bacterium]|nr:class IV adenylate cyclase [Acidobacteriota bacterium]